SSPQDRAAIDRRRAVRPRRAKDWKSEPIPRLNAILCQPVARVCMGGFPRAGSSTLRGVGRFCTGFATLLTDKVQDSGPRSFSPPRFHCKTSRIYLADPPNLPAENSPRESTTRKGARSADDTRTARTPLPPVRALQWSRLRRARPDARGARGRHSLPGR